MVILTYSMLVAYLVVYILAFRHACSERFLLPKDFAIKVDILEDNETRKDFLKVLMVDWERTINVQMHVNDLIIRFRSIVLTAFVTLASVTVAVGTSIQISHFAREALLLFPAVLWLAAFGMDYFYYHRLLLGAVAQGRKFDECSYLKEVGLFGLGNTIRKNTIIGNTEVLIILYYLVPAIFYWIVFFLGKDTVVNVESGVASIPAKIIIVLEGIKSLI
jgi:hypothetical protein